VAAVRTFPSDPTNKHLRSSKATGASRKEPQYYSGSGMCEREKTEEQI
jgi:hypothetical protein